jgi:hypothetical protein
MSRTGEEDRRRDREGRCGMIREMNGRFPRPMIAGFGRGSRNSSRFRCFAVSLVRQSLESFEAVTFLETAQPTLGEFEPTGGWDLIEPSKLSPLLPDHVPVEIEVIADGLLTPFLEGLGHLNVFGLLLPPPIGCGGCCCCCGCRCC